MNQENSKNKQDLANFPLTKVQLKPQKFFYIKKNTNKLGLNWAKLSSNWN